MSGVNWKAAARGFAFAYVGTIALFIVTWLVMCFLIWEWVAPSWAALRLGAVFASIFASFNALLNSGRR